MFSFTSASTKRPAVDASDHAVTLKRAKITGAYNEGDSADSDVSPLDLANDCSPMDVTDQCKTPEDGYQESSTGAGDAMLVDVKDEQDVKSNVQDAIQVYAKEDQEAKPDVKKEDPSSSRRSAKLEDLPPVHRDCGTQISPGDATAETRAPADAANAIGDAGRQSSPEGGEDVGRSSSPEGGEEATRQSPVNDDDVGDGAVVDNVDAQKAAPNRERALPVRDSDGESIASASDVDRAASDNGRADHDSSDQDSSDGYSSDGDSSGGDSSDDVDELDNEDLYDTLQEKTIAQRVQQADDLGFNDELMQLVTNSRAHSPVVFGSYDEDADTVQAMAMPFRNAHVGHLLHLLSDGAHRRAEREGSETVVPRRLYSSTAPSSDAPVPSAPIPIDVFTPAYYNRELTVRERVELGSTVCLPTARHGLPAIEQAMAQSSTDYKATFGRETLAAYNLPTEAQIARFN